MEDIKPKSTFRPTILNMKTHERYELFDGITIGRGRSSTINIDDTKVSRIHLTVKFLNDSELIIEDSSSNGTFINHQKVNGQFKISQDSIIRIGSTELKISFYEEKDLEPKISSPKIKLVKEFKASYEDYPPAPFFKRFISISIDGILIGIASKLVEVLISNFGYSDTSVTIMGFHANITIGTYYYHYFLNKNYQTVGKKAMKLMVVPTDQRKKFSVARILGREIFLKAILGFVSIFTVLLTKNHLAAHDYINKTRVIDVSKGH